MNRETAVVSGLQWPWPVPDFAAAGSWYTFYKPDQKVKFLD